MSTQLQLRRGNTTAISAFTGAVGEVIVDTSLNTLVLQDGVTSGGHYISSQNNSNIIFNQANTAFNTANSAGVYANGAFIQANAAYTSQNTTGVIANNAYTLAVAAVPSSGGTMTGNLNISTATVIANNIQINNSLYTGIAAGLPTPLSNVMAQFTGSSDLFVQINTQNIDQNGSSDHVATADIGTDSVWYIDMGMQGSNSYYGVIQPLDGYLYVQGNTGQPHGNLVIGTTSATPTLQTKIIAGGYSSSNVVATFDTANTTIYGNLYVQGSNIISTIVSNQNFSSASFAQANLAFNEANSGSTYANSAFVQANLAFNEANSGSTYANSAFVQANAAFNVANAALTAASDNTYDQLIFNQANAAFNTANSAGSYANSAFVQANGSYNTVNSLSSFANTNFFTNTGGSISGNVTITGNLSVSGNISYTGNVTSVTITGNTGEFFGNAGTGFNALFAGLPGGFVSEPDTTFQVSSSYNGYSQINQQNESTANQATADYIVTGGAGNNTIYYIDMGYASNTYDGTNPNNSLGTSLLPNDGYIYVQGNTGALGGNLVIGTSIANTFTKVIAGGVNSSNIVTIFTGSSVNLYVPLQFADGSKQNTAFIPTSGVTVNSLSSNTSVSVNNVTSITSTAYTTASTSQVTIDSFATTTYRSAKYQVQITSGTSYHVIELIVLHDGTTPYMEQYGELYTGSSLGTFDASISSGTLNLLFTPTNSSTTVNLNRVTMTI